MVLTVLLSLRRGPGLPQEAGRAATLLFYVVVASLIMPSIIVSLGIGLHVPAARRRHASGLLGRAGRDRRCSKTYTTALGLYTSGLGAHLTWTLPFGLLIMFAVFNRFNPAYEEAARDLGATPWQTFRHVVLPLIGPSVVGIGMFGFTLSWDEIARSLAGHGRPQHPAAGTAGPDHHRHHAGRSTRWAR